MKNSKKWRAVLQEIQKTFAGELVEEDIEEKNVKIEYPYSTEPEFCPHFHRERISEEEGKKQNRPREEFRVGVFFGELPSRKERYASFQVKTSDLVAISDTQCRCRVCGKVFPIEKIQQMQHLFDRLNELGWDSSPVLDLPFMKLCDGIEPVWYRKVYYGEQEYFVDDKYEIEVETERCPTKWECYTEADQYCIRDVFLDETPIGKFHRLPEDKRSCHSCAHYNGYPHIIFKVSLGDGRFELRRIGGLGKHTSSLYPHLETTPDGKCRCRYCKKVFNEEEKKQWERLMGYLGAPHYYREEDIPKLSEQELAEWKEILNRYDYGYTEEDEPFTVFDVNKAVELSRGVEPVFCKNGSYEPGSKPAKILSVLRWENGKWVKGKRKRFGLKGVWRKERLS